MKRLIIGTSVCTTAIGILSTLMWTAFGHPQCLDFRAPHALESPLYYCSQYDEYSCCANSSVTSGYYSRYLRIMNRVRWRNYGHCGVYLKAILCSECDPYAAHIFDTEQHPHKLVEFPGLCHGYCEEFLANCSHLVPEMVTDRQLLTALDNGTFCKAITLSDPDYCFPEMKAATALDDQLDRITGSGDDCLCVQKLADGLQNPTWATFSQDDSSRLYVLEQQGLVWVYLSNWTRLPEPFLDMSDRVFVTRRLADERGLLGLAFHPDFAVNRRFYVYYTAQNAAGYTTVRISQFSATAAGAGDADSEHVLLDMAKPNNYWNHNGGMLFFGADRMLYAAIGDGGSGGDPFNHGQNRQPRACAGGGDAAACRRTLWASMVRLNVTLAATPTRAYGIPVDNPFVGDADAAPELFAWGLRNAWRCSVDRGHYLTGAARGRIFCGDVGQGAHEEIDLVRRGGNYGWRAKEGFACYDRAQCAAIQGDVPPIFDYPHSVGKSITGGYVYRGCRNGPLQGVYVYGDYVNGRLFGLHQVDDKRWLNRELFMCDSCPSGSQNTYERHILSFAEDFQGELYMLATSRPQVDSQQGVIYRLISPNSL